MDSSLLYTTVIDATTIAVSFVDWMVLLFFRFDLFLSIILSTIVLEIQITSIKLMTTGVLECYSSIIIVSASLYK